MRWKLALARNRAMDAILTRVTGKPAHVDHLERVGSSYGGFWIPSRFLNPSPRGGLISAGIGFDVTFDVALQDLGYRVVALDPLPACVAFAREALDGERAKVVGAGLWSRDDCVTFYAPRVSGHDSWSAINIQETTPEYAVQFDVVSLATILQNNPELRQATPRILKMNIEGAEEEVLLHLRTVPERFDLILVHLESLSQVRLRSPLRFLRQAMSSTRLLRDLRGQGYRMARCRNLQMVLVLDPSTNPARALPAGK